MAPKAPKDKANAVVARQSTTRPKRAQVQVACQTCRQRKTKCNALRPCTACVDRRTSCQYETEAGETYGQASKRKFEEVSQACDAYEQLFELLRTRDERDVSEIVRQIRHGRDPSTIINYVKTNDATSVMPESDNSKLEMFLVNLAHSTGSLQDVVRLAMESTTSGLLPSTQNFRKLCNRIVYLRGLETMLQQLQEPSIGADRILPTQVFTIPAGPQLKISQSEFQIENEKNIDDDAGDDYSSPWHVPAEPWTGITTNDEAVSHLVSIFLNWHNPTWCFVEADLFLEAMQSKQTESEFCSPFLVNSILAIASLQSEHSIAFPLNDGDRISRGQHFHDEAIRLWALEENRPCLTNLQALCILSLESNYRAKDRLGLKFVLSAAELDREVPTHGDPGRCAAQDISADDYMRARVSAHWMIQCTHVIMRIAFMNEATAEPVRSELLDIQHVLPDRAETWSGFPLTRARVSYRPKPYILERCKLASILQDLHTLIIGSAEQREGLVGDFERNVESVLARMHRWRARLPKDLQYKWPMSSAVLELHASYHACVMILRISARSRLQQAEESLADDSLPADDVDFRARLAQDHLSNAIAHAHHSAQMLREFRERYGLKITPAWLLQLQAVAVNVLILDPNLANPSLAAVAKSASLEGPILDSHSAFDEVFRCLLGCGVEVMIARAIARMTYHTMMKQRIALSRSTWNLIQVMSETAWHPSNVSQISSTFPNFATIKGHEDNERLSELLAKWESINID